MQIEYRDQKLEHLQTRKSWKMTTFSTKNQFFDPEKKFSRKRDPASIDPGMEIAIDKAKLKKLNDRIFP